MNRAGLYRYAIQWIAANDDNDWLNDDNKEPSVTLSLIADVFGRTTYDAKNDLRSAIAKAAGQ